MIDKQKKILFFAHDGRGLGHLQRLSRIAGSMQGYAACLIVSGHREMSWIVPQQCEYVHLPNLEIFLKNERSSAAVPFLKFESEEDVISFRKKLLHGIITAFAPDAIFTDYLPLGRVGELDEIIKNYSAKKYYIARGVLNFPDRVNVDVFNDKGKEYLERYYDKIFVTCDSRICDLAKEYSLSKILEDKLIYVGYVRGSIASENIPKIRVERGIGDKDIWVVCSLGGGKLGEDSVQKYMDLAQKHPNKYFDIVLGPKTDLQLDCYVTTYIDRNNIRIHKENHFLKHLHDACDISICSGSYNTLVECLQGGSYIITYPLGARIEDEQYIHSQRLSKFVNIAVATDLLCLERAFDLALAKIENGDAKDLRGELNYDGRENIKRIVFEDLL